MEEVYGCREIRSLSRSIQISYAGALAILSVFPAAMVDACDVRRQRARRILLLSFIVLAVCAGVYQDQFLGAPGYITWQDKSATLLSQVGLGRLLNQYQNWRYTQHPPPDNAPDPRLISADAGPGGATKGIASADLPALGHTADNAGWHPVAWKSGAAPLLYTAMLQPDPLHLSVIADAALVRSSAVQAHLVAGTVEPPGFHSSGQIPAAQLPAVVAAFNSGLRLSAQAGGFVLNGAVLRGLIDGKASVAIDDRGRMMIGQWGRDFQMTPHIRAVRQNLALIVDHGRVADGLDHNADRLWGDAGTQHQFTWRSGLGVTAGGDVIYVAGDKLTLSTLAAALVQAGATTGMELTIHAGDEFFASWQADPAGIPRPHRLMTAMVGPPDRFIRPDQEDFFYFTAVAA